MVQIESTVELDHPIAEVFRFYADDHVQNHPRWDEDVKLEATDDRPLGVGSVIKRHVTRMGNDTHGEMTITRFDRDEAFAVDIRDGPMEMKGGANFTALGPERTRVIAWADIPAITDPEVGAAINALMQRSVDNVKRLMSDA